MIQFVNVYSEIASEKTEAELRQGINSFEKTSLSHVEPQEKSVLPSGEGNKNNMLNC